MHIIIASSWTGTWIFFKGLSSDSKPSVKEMGDVEAVVCGHDHDNDYVMKYGDMFYIFGRFSGCDTVYNNVGPSGARIFEFTESEEGFRTYIRKYGSDFEQDLSLRRGMSHLLGDQEKF